jgi:hypothetical protein
MVSPIPPNTESRLMTEIAGTFDREVVDLASPIGE